MNTEGQGHYTLFWMCAVHNLTDLKLVMLYGHNEEFKLPRNNIWVRMCIG